MYNYKIKFIKYTTGLMSIVKFLVINVIFLSAIVDRFLSYDIEFLFNIQWNLCNPTPEFSDIL